MADLTDFAALWRSYREQDTSGRAWSLYHQPDLLAAMRKLVALTRRVFIIIDSDDDAPQYPHHPLITEIWGEKAVPCHQSLDAQSGLITSTSAMAPAICLCSFSR
jgi:hypothetical protein